MLKLTEQLFKYPTNNIRAVYYISNDEAILIVDKVMIQPLCHSMFFNGGCELINTYIKGKTVLFHIKEIDAEFKKLIKNGFKVINGL